MTPFAQRVTEGYGHVVTELLIVLLMWLDWSSGSARMHNIGEARFEASDREALRNGTLLHEVSAPFFK